VLGVGRTGEPKHADRPREAEHHLGGRRPDPPGDAGDQLVVQHFAIGGEQREPLVHDPALLAERPHVTIPAAPGEAAVLHERRRLGAAERHLREMPPRHVAHAEQTRPARIGLADHRGPDRGVLLGPARPRGRAVQHVAVNVIGPDVLERAGHGLRDLRGKVGLRIVGQPVILTVLVGELGLEKQLSARHHACAIAGSQRLPDAALEVVPPLIGRIDAPEARAERQLSDRSRLRAGSSA